MTNYGNNIIITVRDKEYLVLRSIVIKGDEEMSQTQKENAEREVTFEIMEHFGVLSTSPRGWTKEVNLVKWNNGKAKYDIREWDANHKKMSRGITMTAEEAKELADVFSGLTFVTEQAEQAQQAEQAEQAEQA